MASERSRWINGVAGALLAYTLALNVLSLADHPSPLARRPAELLGIDQAWTMFAPSPSRLDGWFVVVAKRSDGSTLDLLTGRAPEWSRPTSFREGIHTTRELVFMRRLLGAGEERRQSFAAARARDDSRPTRIAVYSVSVIDGRVHTPELLVEHRCE